MSVASEVVDILEPLVGRTVADTCVRATALSLGKTSDGLEHDDLKTVEQSVRRLLAPIAPAASVDALVEQMRRIQ